MRCFADKETYMTDLNVGKKTCPTVWKRLPPSQILRFGRSFNQHLAVDGLTP